MRRFFDLFVWGLSLPCLGLLAWELWQLFARQRIPDDDTVCLEQIENPRKYREWCVKQYGAGYSLLFLALLTNLWGYVMHLDLWAVSGLLLCAGLAVLFSVGARSKKFYR